MEALGEGSTTSRLCILTDAPRVSSVLPVAVLQKRFINNIKVTKTCWLWLGYTAHGYGEFKHKKIHYSAHRLSAYIVGHIESLASPLHVLHKCDNPICVNPTHLFAGTAKDNMQDCKRKGRHSWGELNGHSKFNVLEVCNIYEMVNNGMPQRTIAKYYNVGESCISKMIKGDKWVPLYEEYHGVNQ